MSNAREMECVKGERPTARGVVLWCGGDPNDQFTVDGAQRMLEAYHLSRLSELAPKVAIAVDDFYAQLDQEERQGIYMTGNNRYKKVVAIIQSAIQKAEE